MDEADEKIQGKKMNVVVKLYIHALKDDI